MTDTVEAKLASMTTLMTILKENVEKLDKKLDDTNTTLSKRFDAQNNKISALDKVVSEKTTLEEVNNQIAVRTRDIRIGVYGIVGFVLTSIGAMIFEAIRNLLEWNAEVALMQLMVGLV